MLIQRWSYLQPLRSYGRCEMCPTCGLPMILSVQLKEHFNINSQ
jgi:hypothetical protein